MTPEQYAEGVRLEREAIIAEQPDVAPERREAIAACEGMRALHRAELGPIADAIGAECECGAHR